MNTTLFCNHYDATNIEMRGAQSGQRKQRVIDGAERGTRDEQNRQPKMTHHAGHQLRAVDRNERAAGTLGDQILAPREARYRDPAQVNADSGTTRGEMRRHRWIEAVGLGRGPRRRQLRKPHHRIAVRSFARAGLNRLPVDRIECRAEQRRDHRLTNTGVRSSDEKSARHARLPPKWIPAGICGMRRRSAECRRA